MKEHIKCRKDKTAKIPQMLQEIVEFVGEDEMKTALPDLVKHRLSGLDADGESDAEE